MKSYPDQTWLTPITIDAFSAQQRLHPFHPPHPGISVRLSAHPQRSRWYAPTSERVFSRERWNTADSFLQLQ